MAHHAEAAQRKLDELEEKCKILRQHNLLAKESMDQLDDIKKDFKAR